ncbi:MAG TPA: DsbA family protein [Candidatus Latescibacteria bacterium]|nr:DsbA family protein [Candidatus Handelsmanbacteria bacterium]HIL07059.1 DsbA family protein [Candidatus Latescibacterota bacterium]
MARIPKLISGLKTLMLLLATGGSSATVSAQPAAVIGETTITYQALEQHVKGQLIRLEQERYEILRAGLYELIGDQLIALAAEAKDQTPEQFLADEVETKAAQPDSAQIQEVYNSNKKHFAKTPIDEAIQEVTEYLVGQSKQRRYREVLAALEEQHAPRVNLRPPVLEVGTGGRPSLGDASAPITLIEFSDYECHYCKTAEPVIREVLETYGDKVHFVYRDYPLDFHANARPASQAAHCAEQQGQFWAYHEKLMASEDLHQEQYQAIADEVGLDRAKFDACLTSEDFSEAIDRDIADGEAVGVSGTPAFFINGRMLSGSQPFARFKELIDEELERIAGE